MKLICRINKWYDETPEPRRFFKFFIPMCVFIVFINLPSHVFNILGGLGMLTTMIIRLPSVWGMCKNEK